MRTIPIAHLLIVCLLPMLGSAGCAEHLVAEPGRVDFGQVFVGNPSTRSVVWTNAGSDGVRLRALNLGDEANGFDLVNKPMLLGDPLTLSEGQSTPEARIRFRPKTFGLYTAKLTPTTASGTKTGRLALRGRGVYVKQSPGLELSSAGLSPSQPLDLGEVGLNEQALTHELTLVNASSSALVLKPLWTHADQGFTIQGRPKTMRIPYGESKKISLRFQPKSQGIHTDTLRLLSPDRQTLGGVVLTAVGKRR